MSLLEGLDESLKSVSQEGLSGPTTIEQLSNVQGLNKNYELLAISPNNWAEIQRDLYNRILPDEEVVGSIGSRDRQKSVLDFLCEDIPALETEGTALSEHDSCIRDIGEEERQLIEALFSTQDEIPPSLIAFDESKPSEEALQLAFSVANKSEWKTPYAGNEFFRVPSVHLYQGTGILDKGYEIPILEGVGAILVSGVVEKEVESKYYSTAIVNQCRQILENPESTDKQKLRAAILLPIHLRDVKAADIKMNKKIDTAKALITLITRDDGQIRESRFGKTGNLIGSRLPDGKVKDLLLPLVPIEYRKISEEFSEIPEDVINLYLQLLSPEQLSQDNWKVDEFGNYVPIDTSMKIPPNRAYKMVFQNPIVKRAYPQSDYREK
jgi:hypothetical protein